MKKQILTLSIAFCVIIASCVKAPSVEQTEISNESLAVFNNINPVQTLQVPAVNGKITVVTFNGDIICLTKTATSLPVPKTSTLSKADNGIKIDYVDEFDPKYVAMLGENNSTSELWQTLAFEDSAEGDYDYNDLILHLCQQKTIDKQNGELFHIGIHPIALGATKKFRLGCDIYHNGQLIVENYTVATNVREELFLEENSKPTPEKGFLNTVSNNYHCNFFSRILTMPAQGINFANIQIAWFIDVDFFNQGQSKKLYAVNSHSNFLDAAKRPYGIIITETGRSTHWDEVLGKKAEHSASWFEYPREQQNISECYPDKEANGKNSFDAWLAGTSDGSFNMRVPNTEKVFNIAQKEKGHFVYQIEKGNSKDLGSNNYNKERVNIK